MHSKREKKEKPVSVLEGDEKFLKKILSRDSSVRRHLPVSQHYRSAGEVPFQWETMPGTPRNPSSGENVIRAKEEEEEEEEEDTEFTALRPPPVAGSDGQLQPRVPSKKVDYLALPQSCFWRKSLWKRSKKFHQENEDNDNNKNNFNGAFDDCGSFKFVNSDDSDNSRSSSSSSSFLPFANDHGTLHSSSSSSSSSTLKGLSRKIVSWAF